MGGEMGRKWEEIGRGNLNQNLSHKNEFSLKQIRMKIKFYFIIAVLQVHNILTTEEWIKNKITWTLGNVRHREFKLCSCREH